MKKVLAVLLSAVMVLSMAFISMAGEAQENYTQSKAFSGEMSFGNVSAVAYTNDDYSEFYLTFSAFDSDQVLEGTIEDGVVTVTYDATGFFTGDAQALWDSAMADETPWGPIGSEIVEDVETEETTEAKEFVSPGNRNDVLAVTSPAAEKVDKNTQTRLIVTTDAEVDDMNSFLMMLLWANDLDIDGIIYSSSFVHFNGDGQGTTQGEINTHVKNEAQTTFNEDPLTQTEFRPMDLDWFEEVITEDYAADYEYLIQNDPNYPTPEELLDVVRVGNIEFEGDVRFDTEGSDLIKECILDDDERTLYISNWGGPNTLVRALLSIAEDYQDTDEWAEIQTKVVNKIRVLGTHQDYSWGDNNIEELYPGIIQIGGSGLSLGYFRTFEGPIQLRDYFKAPWLTANLKFDHGKIMEHMYLMGDGQTLEGEEDVYQYGWVTYIDWGTDVNLVGMPRYDFEQYDWLAVTDAPGWIIFTPVGLRGLEDGNLGSWAGRIRVNGEAQNKAGSYDEYNYYEGKISSSFSAVRFQEDLMQDWAARAEWTVNSYENCNHAPVVSAQALDIYADAGDIVNLDGIVSDPDGDELSTKWWVYEEASEYSGECTGLEVWNENAVSTKFTVPTDAKHGDYFTIVLEVQDDAEKAMTRYAEVLVHIEAVERENPFSDLSETETYYSNVLDCYEAGLLTVGEDGLFNPEGTVSYGEALDLINAQAGSDVAISEEFSADEPITRGELAVILATAQNIGQTFGAATFNDVPEGSKYYTAVTNISSRSYVTPDENGNYRPDDAVTRAEFYNIIYKAFVAELHG